MRRNVLATSQSPLRRSGLFGCEGGKPRSGFTIVEILIATVIGMIVVAGAYAIYSLQTKSLVIVDQDTQSLQNARMAIEQLSRELRMANFGVIGNEAFTDAKSDSITFLGDVDSDVNGFLAADAHVGGTSIQIDLRDARDAIERSDYIFLNHGDNTEMRRVRQTGDMVDTSAEPDVIYLQDPLEHEFPATTTMVKSVETTVYQFTFGTQTMTKNGTPFSIGLSNVEFHYFNQNELEMVPEAMQSLTQTQRAAIRSIGINIQTQSRHNSGAVRNYSSSVDLRNMGNRGFGLDTCKPDAPSGMSVTNTGTCEHFTLAWAPPLHNSCDGTALTDLAGYKISFGPASGNYFVPANNVSDETLTEYQVQDIRLANDTDYFVSMVAYDTSYNESDSSSELRFHLLDSTRPMPSRNLDATAATGSIMLTWQLSEDVDTAGYRLYRSTSAEFTPGPANLVANETVLQSVDTQFTDTNVVACQTYYYKMTAVDCGGEGLPTPAVYGDGAGQTADSPSSGATNTTSTEDPATPPAVISPFGATGSDRAVHLSWTNSPDPDFDHVIIRSSTTMYPSTVESGESVASVTCQPGAAGAYDHTNLVNGTTYYYSIFACDRCGNCSAPRQASAVPNARAPVVQIVHPAAGSVVANGRLLFQADAYDPDELNISNPPGFATDNGKGIVSVAFNVTPTPATGSWPYSEFHTEYCGFSGDSNPCPEGDVSQWCPGTYNLSVIATDNEGQQTQSPYRQITVQGGTIETDQSYVNNVTGTYRQIVNFQIRNTSAATVKIKTVTASWDRSLARLSAIRIPSSSAVWSQADGSWPAVSGSTISIPTARQPNIASGATSTVQFEYVHVWTNLSSSAMTGDTHLSVASSSGYTQGDTVHIGSGTGMETASVASVSPGSLVLSTPLTMTHGYNERVSQVTDDTEMPMSGVQITFRFDYETSSYGSGQCATDDMSVIVSTGPVIGTAYQDEPAANTQMSTAIGLVLVEDYRPVPVHIAVTDYSGRGISTVKAYYMIDATKQGSAPSTGYTNVNMTFSGTNNRWEGTIPFATNSRVWVYFVATDGNSATDRIPISGSYTYDLSPDTTAPSCPLGLMGVKLGRKLVGLSWQKNSEPDVQGYNIYRRQCGAWSKKYTLVQDQVPATPDVVDYQDDYNKLNLDSNCYGYYVTAVDYSGNQSAACGSFSVSVGACPCP